METQEFNARDAKCTHCGMFALRDPWLHEERYGHAPRFIDADGVEKIFLTAYGISVRATRAEAA